jgi:hypothetical protein
VDITGNTGNESRRRAALLDPTINSTRTPIISRDCIQPVTVSFVEQVDIGPTECPVLLDIKPVPASGVDRGLLAHLHWSLWTSRFGAPHCSISAMAGLGAFDGVGDSIELCSLSSCAS